MLLSYLAPVVLTAAALWMGYRGLPFTRSAVCLAGLICLAVALPFCLQGPLDRSFLPWLGQVLGGALLVGAVPILCYFWLGKHLRVYPWWMWLAWLISLPLVGLGMVWVGLWMLRSLS